jgi:integrase
MLSSRRVATAKPKRGRKALVIADGGNLYLQCTLGETGNVRRSWIFVYALDGAKHAMGLGATHTFSLKEARERARELRQQLANGIDPLAQREADKRARLAEAAKAMTFRQCADAYMKLHSAGWGLEHFDQWRRSLATYVYPKIGDLSVRDIDQAAIMQLIEPIWTTKPTTAGRVRSRIEAVFDYALAHKFREGDNPARILAALPKKSKVAPVQHFAAMEWQDVPQFMSELRALHSTAARCLEFVILTAARSGEAIGAKWDEVDFRAKTWTVPAKRMKARKEHRVPLSASALEILDSLLKGSAYIFGAAKPLQEATLRHAVLSRLRPGNGGRFSSTVTVHGFRAAFKTWSGERTNFANETVELALAHRIGNKVEQSYERGDKFEKRRRLMDAWAKFCTEGAPAAAGVVTPLRRATAHSGK